MDTAASANTASYHKITLHDALLDVVGSLDAMHQKQLELEADKSRKYQKLGSYVKEVDVTFNISANGEVNASGTASGSYPGNVAGGSLTLAGSYKSARGNTITIKFASISDNDAITSGKVRWLPNGDLWVYGLPSAGSAHPQQGRPSPAPHKKGLGGPSVPQYIVPPKATKPFAPLPTPTPTPTGSSSPATTP